MYRLALVAAFALPLTACPDFPDDMCQLDQECPSNLCDRDTGRCVPPAGDGGTTDGGTTNLEGVEYEGTCADGLDNDTDGFTDCQDTGCAGAPSCALTIKDVQNPASPRHPAEDSEVTITGVIVTAVKKDSLSLWSAHVQMPESGPYSAIAVTSPVQVNLGDQVSVTGAYREEDGASRIQATSVTRESMGNALPEPAQLQPGELVTDGYGDRQWEAVLVRIDDVSVLNATVTDLNSQENGAFSVTDGLVVGDYFGHSYADDLQQAGQAFDYIVGVMRNHLNEFRIQPRSEQDITFLGGTHPAREVTIEALQHPANPEHPAVGARVRVVNAVITGIVIADFDAEFTVQQESGPYSGLWVQWADVSAAAGLDVGDVVSFIGTYGELDNELTQVVLTEAPLEQTRMNPPAPLILRYPSDLNDVNGEPYEGVLVQLHPAAPMTVGGSGDFTGWFTVSGVTVGDTFFSYTATSGQSIESITGLVSHVGGGYVLMPRSVADVVTAAVP